ncbi:MAG: galactokinase [Elusimicrobiota bacterium]|jgi:D-glycero-alpha-D-manno-heptose-7-phosphate kinase
MIICRSPLRISLGGGGTDLPSYYERRGGFVLSAAIDKYVYITLHDTFDENLIIKYSKLEKVSRREEIRHDIIREAFLLLDVQQRNLELASMADIPAGTGLGSSGSFTTALLKALHAHRKDVISPRQLADEAVEIELGRLKEPIGKQDQYIASFGGVTCFEFRKDARVDVAPLRATQETLFNLEDDLLLFFTGYSRSASDILREQDDKTKVDEAAMLENLDFVKELGLRTKAALEGGRVRELGEIMDVHWKRKKQRSGGMTNPRIDEWYEIARRNGALGGKLVGAGGGGFLLFLAEDKARLRDAMHKGGLKEVRFRFDYEGSKVVVQA